MDVHNVYPFPPDYVRDLARTPFHRRSGKCLKVRVYVASDQTSVGTPSKIRPAQTIRIDSESAQRLNQRIQVSFKSSSRVLFEYKKYAERAGRRLMLRLTV